MNADQAKRLGVGVEWERYDVMTGRGMGFVDPDDTVTAAADSLIEALAAKVEERDKMLRDAAERYAVRLYFHTHPRSKMPPTADYLRVASSRFLNELRVAARKEDR